LARPHEPRAERDVSTSDCSAAIETGNISEFCTTASSEDCGLLGDPSLRTERPRGWANPMLFESVGPSSWDLVNRYMDGSKSSYEKAKKGFAKVSLGQQGLLCPQRGAMEKTVHE
jgi:hypothetical protein